MSSNVLERDTLKWLKGEEAALIHYIADSLNQTHQLIQHNRKNYRDKLLTDNLKLVYIMATGSQFRHKILYPRFN